MIPNQIQLHLQMQMHMHMHMQMPDAEQEDRCSRHRHCGILLSHAYCWSQGGRNDAERYVN